MHSHYKNDRYHPRWNKKTNLSPNVSITITETFEYQCN